MRAKSLSQYLGVAILVAACGGGTEPETSDGPGSGGTGGSYDFAVDFVAIAGNIDAVAGCASADFDFIDQFGDNSLDSGCTAELDPILGTFSESSGFLRMPGPGAAFYAAGGWVGHATQFNQILVDGQGDAEFVVGFRADTPGDTSTPSRYGIKLIDDSLGPFLEAAMIQVQLDAAGGAEIRAYRSRPNDDGIYSVKTAVDLASSSRIDLKLEFVDASDLTYASYSLDGGMTYTWILNPDGSNFAMPGWDVEGGRPASPTAVFEVFAAEGGHG